MNGILSILSAPAIVSAPASTTAIHTIACELRAVADLLCESDDHVKSNTGLLLGGLVDRLFDSLEDLNATT